MVESHNQNEKYSKGRLNALLLKSYWWGMKLCGGGNKPVLLLKLQQSKGYFTQHSCHLSIKSPLQHCNVDLFHHFLFHLSKVIQKFNKTNVWGEAARALPPCQGGILLLHTHTAWYQHFHTYLWHLLHMNIRPREEQQFTSAVIWVCIFCVDTAARMMPGFSLLTKALFLLNLGGSEGFKVYKAVAWQDTTAIDYWLNSSWFGRFYCVGILTAWLRGKELCFCVCAHVCVLIVSAVCIPLSIQWCESCIASL